MDENERKRLLYPEHPGWGPDEEPTTATLHLTFDVICEGSAQTLADDLWGFVQRELEDRGVAVDGGTGTATDTPPPNSEPSPR